MKAPTRTEIRTIATLAAFFISVVGVPIFRAHLQLWMLLAVGVVFAITAPRGRRGLERALCVGFCALVVALLCWKLPEAYPLRKPVVGKHFANVPLVEVLTYLRDQNTSSPTWRFYVWDDSLAKSRISVTVPDGSLGDAIAAINAATQSEFDWHWHRFCATEPTPTCAEFRLWPRSAPGPDRRDFNYALALFSDGPDWSSEARPAVDEL